MRVRDLDVRDLEPPLPLQRALAALHALRPDEYLRLLHRREPLPLYGMLADLGFRHRTRVVGDGSFAIAIWHAAAAEPGPDA